MTITDAVPKDDSVVEASHRYFVDSTEADQGVATATGDRTIKDHVDAIGATKKATLYFRHDFDADETDYTLTTNTTISSNITVEIENGAILDGVGTLTISGHFNAGFRQVFGTSVTILFGVNSVTEIHPEWWGTFPNGTDDTTILNKAIAAADLVGTFDGYADASIIVRPGRYYIADNSLSAIKTNFLASNAMFVAVTNSNQTNYLFRFDFTEADTYKTIDIGSIFGRDVIDDTAHYNIGLSILGGGGVRARIGQIAGLFMGIASLGATYQKHVGQWNFDISTILGCDYGIYASAGTATNSEFELNRFNIDWVANTKQVVALSNAHANAKNLVSNIFNIRTMDLHMFDDQNGFWVSGALAMSNKFVVEGGLVRPTGTGLIVALLNDANENLFELSYIDWDLISTTGAGYNIFRETSNHNTAIPVLSLTNDFGRSEVNGTAAPTGLAWRKGDKFWNSAPDGGGTLGWVCVTSGTPGTWKIFGSIAA